MITFAQFAEFDDGLIGNIFEVEETPIDDRPFLVSDVTEAGKAYDELYGEPPF